MRILILLCLLPTIVFILRVIDLIYYLRIKDTSYISVYHNGIIDHYKSWEIKTPSIGVFLNDLFGYYEPNNPVPNVYFTIYALIIISAIVFGGRAIYANNWLEDKHNSILEYRETLRKEYYHYQDLSIIDSKQELLKYDSIVHKVNDFNENVYYINENKDNPWIGLFLNKGYVNIEPIKLF